MNRLFKRQTILLLACYLLFLLIYFPAEFAVRWLGLPNNIVLSGIQGSVWRGEVSLLSIDHLTVESVRWHLGFSGIYPVLRLSTNDNNISGQANLRWRYGSYSLDSDLNIAVPYLQSALNLPIPAAMEGRLRANLTEASFDNQRCQVIKGTIRWQDAQFNSLLGRIALGDTLLKPDCHDGNIIFNLEQQSDVLITQATITINENNYSVNAQITPGANIPPILLSGLRQTAQPDSKGVFHIEKAGTLSPL